MFNSRRVTDNFSSSILVRNICRTSNQSHFNPIFFLTMMHSSITRTIYHNSNLNLGSRLLNHETEHLKMKPEIVGVTLSRIELAVVLTMYISAVVILVILFEYLKPSLTAHLMGTTHSG